MAAASALEGGKVYVLVLVDVLEDVLVLVDVLEDVLVLVDVLEDVLDFVPVLDVIEKLEEVDVMLLLRMCSCLLPCWRM